MRVYLFERIDDSLGLLPLAARRALDAARIKVSLEAWRQSPVTVRRTITALGSVAVVDEAAVHAAVAESHLPWSPIHASDGESAKSAVLSLPDEPSPESVPPELTHAVSGLAWRALAPLDRYALWKVARGKHPEEVLPRACAEIVPSGLAVPLSTHVNERGEAHMVDVGGKEVTSRQAVAHARVSMQAATAARLRAGDVAKGDVLATARIAGIQAAKRTSELIPLCHAIALTRVAIDLAVDDDGVAIEATAEARDRTGVEMEALTAASVAALTVYDMLKSVDRGMRITVELTQKSGGKTGMWLRK